MISFDLSVEVYFQAGKAISGGYMKPPVFADGLATVRTML